MFVMRMRFHRRCISLVSHVNDSYAMNIPLRLTPATKPAPFFSSSFSCPFASKRKDVKLLNHPPWWKCTAVCRTEEKRIIDRESSLAHEDRLQDEGCHGGKRETDRVPCNLVKKSLKRKTLANAVSVANERERTRSGLASGGQCDINELGLSVVGDVH